MVRAGKEDPELNMLMPPPDRRVGRRGFLQVAGLLVAAGAAGYAGGTVAGSEFTPFGKTTNFQPYLARIERSGAKAVYCFYAGAEAVAFVKQYQQFGLASKIPLYCSGFATEGGVLKAQGDAALGIKTSLHYSDQIDNPTNTKKHPGPTENPTPAGTPNATDRRPEAEKRCQCNRDRP